MENVYKFGPFRLETKERRLLRQGQPVRLRGKVLDTLCVLVAKSGSLIGKDELMAAVWPDTVVEENNLAHNINALRKALGDEAMIETVPGKGYRFLGSGSQPVGAAIESLPPRAPVLPIMMERDEHMASLREAFAEAALRGKRQFVCVPGEAGVGKTTLVQAFLQEVRHSNPNARIGRGQCLANRGDGEPYLAVLEALGRLCREQAPDGDEVTALLYRRAPTWLAQMPWLASAPALAQLPQRNLGVTRERMVREFAEFVEELSSLRPLVLCLDDLHWSDDSTLSLLELLARRDDPARLMLIATYRPTEAAKATQPLETLAQGLRLRGLCRFVRPALLSADAVEAMLGRALPGMTLEHALIDTVHQRTSGNPLFVLALIDHWKTTSAVVQSPEGGGRWRAGGDLAELGRGVPESLTAMIHQKVETLSPEELLLLEAASVAGREFVAGVLATALGWTEDETELRCAALARQGSFIVDAGIFEWPGSGGIAARFRFIHALYREAVYGRVPAGRCARMHRLIGEALVTAYGVQAADAHANQLAQHFAKGGDRPRAIRYFRLAGEQALRRSAHREAVRLFESGLELLGEMPETPERHSEEFAFRSMMAPAVLAVKGFTAPEAVFNFERARELGLRLVRVEEMYQLLFHLASMHELRGEYELAEQILDERLRLPGAKDGAAVQIDSDTLLACSLFHQGEFSRAIKTAANGVDLYDPKKHAGLIASYGENPAVACHGWAALALWCLGYADQAMERVRLSLELAGHPDLLFSLAGAKVRTANVYQLRRDPAETLRWATEAADLAEKNGYLYASSMARALKGWAVAMTGRPAEGQILVREGMALLDRIGANMDRPYLLALSAEIGAANGQTAEALAQVTEALGHVRESRAYFWEAELYRLRGVLLSRMPGGSRAEAEASIRQAVEIARKQEARALELRATVSLCRLPQPKEDSLRKLAASYRWFREGAGTADLVEAGEMLAGSAMAGA